MKRWLWLLLFAGGSSLAAESVRRFEVTPFAAYRIGGTFQDDEAGRDYELDEAGAYGLRLNLLAEANTQYELGWSRQTTALDLRAVPSVGERIDLDVDYYQLGGTYQWDGNRLRPFMVATLGAARYAPEPAEIDAETYFAFSIGGGWQLRPTSRLGLRLEGRFYGTWLSGSSRIFCTSASAASGCLIQASGDLLWQWEMSAGAVFRF